MAPAPKLPGEGRPPPPSDLGQREREIWIGAVNARPAHYFDAPCLPLLSSYCTNVWLLEYLAEQLRRNPNNRNLRAEHRHQTAVTAMLAHKLRISKLSSRKHQSVEANEARGAARRRLWEVVKGDAGAD